MNDLVLEHVASLIPDGAKGAKELLSKIIALRQVAASTREAIKTELFGGWPRVADLDDAERAALDTLLTLGLVEVRLDGGFLDHEVREPNSTVVPGWRLEAIGFGRLDLVLQGAHVTAPTCSLDDLELSTVVRGILTSTVLGFDANARVMLALIGQSGSGKTAAAHALTRALGGHVLTLSAASLRDPRRSVAKNIQIVKQLAQDQGLVVLLEPGERFFPRPGPESSTAESWQSLLQDPPALLVISCENADWLHPSVGRRADSVITLGGLRGRGRVALWKRCLQGHELADDVNLERLAMRYDLLPGATINAIKVAVRRSKARGQSGRLELEDIEAGALLQVRHKLDSMAQQVWARLSLDDLILDEDTAGTVRDIIEAAKVRETVFDEWGFAAKNNRGRGLSILFDGEPGTGKTLCAEVLAAEMGLPLYRVSMANIMSKYVGETEKNLQRIFDEARGSRSILLFDEADALFSQRVEVKGSNDRFANMEVNVLLQLMEGHDGICVLTTNLKKGIDKAFERRLSYKLHFPFPDANQPNLP